MGLWQLKLIQNDGNSARSTRAASGGKAARLSAVNAFYSVALYFARVVFYVVLDIVLDYISYSTMAQPYSNTP
jgi:hypothetical protein